MLYMGHFSFESRESEAATSDYAGGSFTCLVEAESVEAAAEKFSALIISLDDSFEGFESVGNVFVDVIIEVKKLPDQGVLAHFEERAADTLGTIFTSLPGVPEEFCVAYDWGSEDWGSEDEEDDGGREVKPFVIFEE